MKKSILFLWVVLIKSIAVSQDTIAFKVSKAENKFVYSESTVKIFKGQRISIKASNSTGQLMNLQLVNTAESKIISPSKLGLNLIQQNNESNITIDLNTIQQDDGKVTTYLIVNNPYKGTMTYKAKFFSRRTNEYIETSIYPVSPGISGIETWPYAITDLILYEFTIKE